MIDDELDGALERVFQAAFGMTREQEDALWWDFSRRTLPENDLWAVFTGIMLQVNAGLHQATAWSYWPARGVPGLA